MKPKSRPIIALPRYHRRRSCSIWSICMRRNRMVYFLAAIIIISALYAFNRLLKPGEIIHRTRPRASKPPLVDRSQMERLGMYDEPEPADQEWMGPGALRLSEINKNARDKPLSVTALPDSKPTKHDRLVSNVLADWKLCGTQDSRCRLVLVRPCLGFLCFCSWSLINYPACVHWGTRI